MSSIHISVNGTEHTVAGGCTLEQLVARLQSEVGQPNDPTTLATALNEVFIPRSKRDTTILSEGDQVFTFSPITGG